MAGELMEMTAAAAREGNSRQAGRVIRAGFAACLLVVCTLVCVAIIGDSRTGDIVLKQLNFLNNYSVRTDVVGKMLEKYRIERDVALAHMGHPSLTEVPQNSPAKQREELKELKLHALNKLHRLSRGRHPGDFGLKDGNPLQAATNDDDGNPDCDPGDAQLGLCGVSIPSPHAEELSDAEEKVNKELTKHEEESEADRDKIIAQIDKKRLEKAQSLMKKLTETDHRINELVHHAIKVAGMAPHTPDP